MNILDCVCAVIIMAVVFLGAMHRQNKLVIKLCAFAASIIAIGISMMFASKFLLPNAVEIKNIRTNFSGIYFAEKIGRTGFVVSIFEAMFIFVPLFILLKKMFAIVSGKIGRSIRCVIIDTILGALAGLMTGTAFLFVFKKIVIIIRRVDVFKKTEKSCDLIAKSSLSYELVRNLN